MSWVVLAIGAVVLLALGVTVGRSYRGEPTKAEKQAGWVLAEDPAVRKLRAERDSAIKIGLRETERLKRQVGKLKDSVATLIQDVDQDRAEAAIAADIPTGITPADTVVRLQSALARQTQVAARLRDEVVPALQRVIHLDSLTIDRQDAALEMQRLALNDEYRRNDQLTVALRNLREERKGGGPWLDCVGGVAGTQQGVGFGAGCGVSLRRVGKLVGDLL